MATQYADTVVSYGRPKPPRQKSPGKLKSPGARKKPKTVLSAPPK
jgi:hypothetical protein